jgi:endonuclease/exonuclease/phosphatase family metal-dependent hydrolase
MHLNSAKRVFRVMTYNVHGCVGTDGKRSEARIADVIAAGNVDIAGLQELDLGRRRSAGVDQAALIAGQLGWHHKFHPAMSRAHEHYGDAILSRFPITPRQARELPAAFTPICPEKRSAQWVEIHTDCGCIHVINTHLGIGRRERHTQAKLLAGPEWIGSIPPDEPLVLLGDLNSLPGSRPWRVIAAQLHDVRTLCLTRAGRGTFHTALPILVLDYIFVNSRFSVREVRVFQNALARRASDHFPLIGTLEILDSVRLDAEVTARAACD